MRIEIDATLCQGHGRCYILAPEVFDMDDEGKGIVTQPLVSEGHAEDVQKAVASCPEQAISILDV